MTTELQDFQSRVSTFARETGDTLRAVFDPTLTVDVEHRAGIPKSVVKANVPLHAVGTDPSDDRAVLARLEVQTWCGLDSTGKHLAVVNSQCVLVAVLDRAPIIRFEYDRVSTSSKPGAHIQVQAHRGALSHLLSRTGHRTPHSMESLHLPVGGDRFRVCLEDVIEFLIIECKFEGRANWQSEVRAGRARWRRFQLLSAVRDTPSVAIEALQALGYSVIAPDSGHAQDNPDKNRDW